MTVTTCLLVTDDPDDHQSFSEAFAEISENAVVLIVLDSLKALTLIRSQKHAPDYIFLDLSMHNIRINTFLNTIRGDRELRHTPTVVYGDETSLIKVGSAENVIFFNKHYEYSELRDFLAGFFKQETNDTNFKQSL
jgi:CheY-like chemotaxis protein